VNERDLFIAALQIDDPAKRSAFLDVGCGEDAELRLRVEALLKAFAQAGSFMQQPAAAGATSAMPPGGHPLIGASAEAPGTVIGPYKLLQQIGEGGMGTVFMAEQTVPVQRKVALKLIKAGLDSQQVIARFEAERQALALMDHPNIAKVLDAGTTEGGRPYFVMELVKGMPVTRYCDEHHLMPRQRLELFVPVCQAVQHAHQKGIIHRDLKPSNIMVCLYDGKPVPKVIDFGIAKATGTKLTERTLFTEFGAVVGTLEYMSPEQAELNQLDIDTRSDIYSLGVLFYELLTGTTPLERGRLKEAAFLEVLRLIREEEPPKPSTRLSTTERLPSIAANRGCEPKQLGGLVRGELDWIAMKCLEKDRNRRYESANGLAADVQRYLADEAVEACPPSASYRFRKFARRNKAALATSALVLGFLLLGIVGLAISNWRINGEKELVRQEKEQKVEALKLANANLRKALDAVDQMLTEVGQERLSSLPHMEETRRKLLEKALEFYEGLLSENSDDPVVRFETAMAYRRVGEIRYRLGRHEQALKAYDQAIAIFQPLAAAGGRHDANLRELARTNSRRGVLLRDLGRIAEAQQSQDQSRAAWEQLLANDPQDDDRNELARCLNLLALVQFDTGSTEDAVRTWQQTLKIDEELAARKPARLEWLQDLVKHSINLGGRLADVDRFNEAEEWLRKAVTTAKALVAVAPAEPDYQGVLAGSHTSLANVLRAAGRFGEAEPVYRNALEVQEKLVADFAGIPEYRLWLADSHGNLGILFWQSGRKADAVAAYQKARALYERLVADFPAVATYHNHLANMLMNLAYLLSSQGQGSEARPILEAAINHQRAALELKPNQPVFLRSLANHYLNLALLLDDMKAPPEEQDTAYQRAIESMRELWKLAPDAADSRSGLGGAMQNWASSLKARGDLPAARKLLDEAVAHQQAAHELNPRNLTYRDFLSNTLLNLAETLQLQGEPREAEAVWRRAAEVLESLVHDLPGRTDYAENLAMTYVQLSELRDEPAEQAELVRKAVELTPGNAGRWTWLGVIYCLSNDWKAAVVALEKAEGLDPEGTETGQFHLAIAHAQLGHREEAKAWYDRALAWVERNRQELQKFPSRVEADKQLQAAAEEALKPESEESHPEKSHPDVEKPNAEK